MKRVELEADQMPGQDSFLDVITNIVGILILLVLVVGLRTSRAVQDASAGAPAADAKPDREMRAAYAAVVNSERSVRQMVYRARDAVREANFRDEERLWLTTAVAKAEREIASRREQLSKEDQRDFDLRRQLADAQSNLDELTRQQIALVSQDAPTEKIECEPTPLARVVTNKQVHLLLSEDHVAIVPFDELVELAKADVQENTWRLRQQDEMERTIGPINGFRLRYWFVKSNVMARTAAGAVVAGSVSQFSHCCFLPVNTPAGEPAAEAIQSTSELFQNLQRLKPDSTTITIWTHPGNYDRLRELKRAIREREFQIAVRPLPKGMPIGASRHGSESLSE
jgi:hypothetical protein